jgi:hypothetical protein
MARATRLHIPDKDIIPNGRRGGVQPPTRRPSLQFAAGRGASRPVSADSETAPAADDRFV